MATLRTYSATVNSLGPLARWRFNETEGNVAVDRVGDLDGTYVGNPVLVAGVIGDGAASFDGGDGVEVDSAGSGIRLAVIGDSFAAGLDLPTAQSFPRQLEAALEDLGHDINLLNGGPSDLGGNTFAQTGYFSEDIVGLLADIRAAQPEVVVLAVGANDSLWGVDPAETEANLREIITQLKEDGVQVLLTGTYGLWPNEIFDATGYEQDPDTQDANVTAFEAIFADLAAELGVPLVAKFSEPIRNNPDLQNQIDDDRFEGNVEGPEPDGVHPNADGVLAIVEHVLPQVEGLVEAVESGGGGEPSADPLALAEGSIEMWFVPDSVEGAQALLSKDAPGNGVGQLRVILDGAQVRVAHENGSVVRTTSGGTVQAGEANQLVIAFGAAGIVLYVNGVEVDANALALGGLTGNTAPLAIGTAQSGAAVDFEGVVDEVVVYGDVLTADQVAALFQAGPSGPNLTGTSAADTILGDADANDLKGLGGNDELRGYGGDDTLRGSGGADTAYGNGGDDRMLGGGGGDVMRGGPDNDTLNGGPGADRLFGNAGDDLLRGNGGKDLLNGGGGADELFGQGAADDLRGGAGDDLLDGGPGPDLLTGGSGADTFVKGALGDRVDDILDFDPAEGDVLDLSAVLDGADPSTAVQLTESGADTGIAVSPDGGAFVAVFNLVGVTGLEVDQLVADGNIVS